MIIISDSPTYLLKTVGKKNGIVFENILDFPLSADYQTSKINSDVLILISEYFYKYISIKIFDNFKTHRDIDFAFEQIEKITKDAFQKGKRVFIPLIPTHYLYVNKNFENYSYSISTEFEIHKINSALINKFENHNNVIILSGIKHIYDSISKDYFRFSSIYNKANSELIIKQLCAFFNQEKHKQKKLIIMDLDNTLWKGIVGEDSLKGIRMDKSDHIGAVFYQVQRLLLNLKKNGFLLAICSKNDEKIGLEALFNNPSSQFKTDDIVSYKINWKPKSENIIDICKELNLSLLETIFIDDSEHECDEVKKNCPGITILKVPSNIYNYPSLIINEPSLNIGLSTNEDKKRTSLYQDGIKRKELLNETIVKKGSKVDWLKSLQIKLKIEVISKSSPNLQRILQLFNRTNQFHLSGNKFNLESFLNKIENSKNIYYQGTLQDRLGSEGLVSVIGIEIDDKLKKINIIEFILSCRVFGRMIEKAMIIDLLKFALLKKYEINFLIKKNSRNKAIQNFIDNEPIKSKELSLKRIKQILREFQSLPIHIEIGKSMEDMERF